VFEDIKRAISSPPKVTLSIQCYHMEEKAVESSNARGDKTWKKEQVKVVTSNDTKNFEID
jgi:hypothetical protein